MDFSLLSSHQQTPPISLPAYMDLLTSLIHTPIQLPTATYLLHASTHTHLRIRIYAYASTYLRMYKKYLPTYPPTFQLLSLFSTSCWFQMLFHLCLLLPSATEHCAKGHHSQSLKGRPVTLTPSLYFSFPFLFSSLLTFYLLLMVSPL